VFQDLPTGGYTVTAESTQGAVTVRGERSDAQIDAGTAAVLVSMLPPS
jgi:hypothetical protein